MRMSRPVGHDSVSVIIPIKDREHVVERAIESIQSQTTGVGEIIIVDDASDDASVRVVTDMARRDGRILVLRHAANRGAQGARNTGIAAATGAWIAFLDSDDVWLPDSLERRLEVAAEDGVDVVHSEALMDTGIGTLSPMLIPPMSGEVYKELLLRPGPTFQSLLVRRELMERLGTLDESITSYQEWDTAIRLAQLAPFSFLAKPTFVWDCCSGGRISSDDYRTAVGYEQVFRKYESEVRRIHGIEGLRRHHAQMAVRYRAAGKRVQAWRHRLRQGGWAIRSFGLLSKEGAR